MSAPVIRNGKFHAGKDCTIGENVVIDVAEDVVIGDRCVIADNTYFGGRRVEIGNDFYGYSWEHPETRYVGFPSISLPVTGRWLDIGRGRIDEEDAILTVGNRCTFHDNRIDLARRVTIGDDVGLSPEVVIYTHGYWLNCLHGYPCDYLPVHLGHGTIVGFRSVVLPGVQTGARVVVGAQSVVTGFLEADGIFAGSPAKFIRRVTPLALDERKEMLLRLLNEYADSCEYRWLSLSCSREYPFVYVDGCYLDVEKGTLEGEETPLTDDLRWFLFTRGIRIYTQRPFRKLGRKQ